MAEEELVNTELETYLKETHKKLSGKVCVWCSVVWCSVVWFGLVRCGELCHRMPSSCRLTSG